MTNSDQTAEPDAKNTTLVSENAVDPAQSVSAESAHEHMSTIGRLLYDIIQDWQHQRKNDSMGERKLSTQKVPNELEGSQV